MIVVKCFTATDCKTCPVQVLAHHMTCVLAWYVIMYVDLSVSDHQKPRRGKINTATDCKTCPVHVYTPHMIRTLTWCVSSQIIDAGRQTQPAIARRARPRLCISHDLDAHVVGGYTDISSYLKTQRGTCDSLKVCGMQIHLLKTDAGLSV